MIGYQPVERWMAGHEVYRQDRKLEENVKDMNNA